MNTDPKTANSIGGKTARACDSCLRKRARFYCASDDAFLCQNCDSSVHSANQLASRHERIRLGTASFKPFESKTLDDKPVPAWHKWLTRKARTPRHSKPASGQQFKDEVKTSDTFPLVPEIGSEDDLFEETEAQLLYRVPVFDPFDAELCNLSNESEGKRTDARDEPIIQNETNVLFSASGNDEACELENFLVYLPSDMELAMGFADVNSLFGTRFDEESHRIEGLGLIDCKENVDNCYEGSRVKVEDEEKDHFHSGLDISKETLDWDFHNESPVTGEEEEEEKVVVVAAEMEMTHRESKESRRKEKFLRLNYEEVISAWDNQGCPWTSGIRPEFNPDEGWPEFMGTHAVGGYDQLYGGSRGRLGCSDDGGREARVSRYKEKRRTRLFSKKIRYEVRKLNAEKRPRMKGRFVKRTTSFAAGGSSTFPNHIMN